MSTAAPPVRSERPGRVRRALGRVPPRTLLGALSLLAAFAVVEVWRGEAVTLVVDADIDRGSVMELFHNDLWTASQRQPVREGRSLYRFEDLPPRLWSLRLDPTDDRAARIRIHGIRVMRGAATLRELSPPEIARWSAGNVILISVSPEALELRSTTGDPMLNAPGTMDFPGGHRLSGVFDTSRPEMLFGLACVSFLLLGAVPWRGWAAAALPVLLPSIALLSTLAQKAITRSIGVRLGGYLPPSEAVGPASWLGYPKLADFRIYLLTVLLSVALGALGGLGLRRLGQPAEDGEPQEPGSGRRPFLIATVVVAGLLVLDGLLSFPSLAQRLDQLRHQTHTLSYDEGNFFIWAWLLHTGRKPFVDFWYPYTGFASFGSGGWFPWGDLLSWAHQLLLLAVAGWALLRLCRRQPLVAPVIVAVLLFGYLVGLLNGGERYLLALAVALLGLAAREDGYPRGPLLLLALLGVYAFLLEPTQLVTAAVPLTVLLAEDLLASREGRHALLRKLSIAGGVFLLGVMGVIGVRAARGQLPGMLEFFGQFGAMTTYGALPAAFVEWYRFTGSQNNLALWAPLLLLALAGASRVWNGRLTSLGGVALTCGLLGAISFNKFLVRPQLATNMLVYSVVGLALVVTRLFPALRPGQRGMLLAVAAALSWLVLDSEDGSRLGERFRGLEELPPNLAAIPGDHSATELAFYEDASRYPEQAQLLRRLEQLGGTAGGGAGKIFVLGDDAFLYSALARPTPYYLTIYNASPLEAQARVVAWLDREAPPWLVWRPEFESFDGVPNVVRVPLLYRAVVRGYEPVERIGPFEILRRRMDPAGPVDLRYWVERLGAKVDLGALPGLSTLAALPACGAGEDCIPALRVDIERPVRRHRRVVPVELEGQRFELGFTELPGQRAYYLRLDRMWFWSSPRSPAPERVGDPGPGARVQRVALSGRRSALW